MTTDTGDATTRDVAARDRLQHFIVEALASRSQCRDRLVFKGGTLLRTCWREEYRYSEDLDFDWITERGDNRQGLGRYIQKALTDASRRAQADLNWRDQRGRLAITWTGPDGRPNTIKIDLSRRTYPNYTPSTREWTVIPRYPGLTGRHTIVGYTLEAMLTAKLTCLANPSRLAPRDFLDTDELLHSDEVDIQEALKSFLATHFPTLTKPPSQPDIYDALLLPGINEYDALSEKWSARATQGIVPSHRRDFDAIFDSVAIGLSAAIQALKLPPPPMIGPSGIEL
ncbi:MAG: nucleotidyl transferase AbiEii/AbiGii toxin family protein [Acidimicrobiia bacterium]|nr:nucleotidyl transferase AbiEii/AbiGii toxin family protein [Acidimicrobiia bacterium]